MRLTADIILRASSRFNPLNQRELELRGFKIPAIENLAVTQDQYDTIDFSDNELRKIDNLPRLLRLVALYFNNNAIRIISPEIGEKCPKLETLILTNNRISSLSEVDNLSSCRNLRHLSFLGNPIIHKDNYRLYAIHRLPGLRSLDFRKVKRQEKADAERLFASKEGRALKASVAQEAANGAAADGGEEERKDTNGEMTDDHRRQIREAIARASTPAEVDRIERQLRAGTFPFVRSHVEGAQVPMDTTTPAPAPAPTPAPTPTKRSAPEPISSPAPVQATPSKKQERSPPPAATTTATTAPSTPMEVEQQQPSKRSRTSSVSSAKGAEADSESTAVATQLTPASAKKLKVAELKQELEARGLSTAGLKADLLERLMAHLST